jgi:hypothetical protein
MCAVQVLPSSSLDYRGFAQYWSSVGINIRDAAALLGAHSAIDNNKGGDPVNWSSSLYLAQVRGGATVR